MAIEGAALFNSTPCICSYCRFPGAWRSTSCGALQPTPSGISAAPTPHHRNRLVCRSTAGHRGTCALQFGPQLFLRATRSQVLYREFGTPTLVRLHTVWIAHYLVQRGTEAS